MNTGNGGKKTAGKQAKKRKLFKEVSGPSSRRSEEVGQSTEMNSDGGEKKANADNGKSKKRKLFRSEDGSEIPSKRRVHGDNMEHPDETVAKEHREKTIIDLPGELLTKIIDMVPISQRPSLELVSHRFQDVVHGLWGQQRDIRLDKFVYNKEKKSYQAANSVLRKFLLRAPNVASISGFAVFCGPRTSIRRSTILLLSKFKHLQSIDFSGQIRGQRVVAARNFAVFLESSASRQCWRNLDIDGGINGQMKSVGSQNHPALNLESFKFNMDNLCICIFDRFLPVEWSGLKKLVIIDSFGSANKLSIIHQCTQVAHLEIAVPDCRNGHPSYCEFMQAVADLENLSILKIDCSWCDRALLVLIRDLGRRRRLVDLALLGISCNDEILGAVIDHLPHLKSLDVVVNQCSMPLLVRLANEMIQLETLKLRFSWNTAIDGSVIRAIVGNMSSLRRLHLQDPNVNLKDLKCLGGLRNLKELRIRGRYTESEIVDTWARLGFGSSLETLELSFLNGISAEVMGGFLKNMPHLRSVKLMGATDSILEAIALSCPNLIEIDLWGFTSITSAGIQSVIDHCPQLKILKVCDCFEKEWFPAALTVGKYRKITFIKFVQVSGKYIDFVCP